MHTKNGNYNLTTIAEISQINKHVGVKNLPSSRVFRFTKEHVKKFVNKKY